MKNIVVFASGNGTNAENFIRYFQHHPFIRVTEVLTNNPKAGVIERARRWDVPVRIFSRDDFAVPHKLIHHLVAIKTDLIILAGFLWKIPTALIQQFPRKIINIHPALLPGFGGKGMYGRHVHEAVIASGNKKSGITIHYVNENYDDGQVLFQAITEVSHTDTPESLAEKIHQLEYAYFPKVIENLLQNG